MKLCTLCRKIFRSKAPAVERVYKLPFRDTGSLGDINIESNGSDLRLRYEFGSKVGSLVFTRTVAFRYRNERHSGMIFDGSTCGIVTVSPSPWLEELLRSESAGDYFSVKKCQHFAIFLSSNGFLEVAGQSFAIEDETEGDLQHITFDTDMGCRIYIDAELENEQLVDLLARFYACSPRRGDLFLPWGVLTIDTNDEFDNTLKMKPDDGFLYFKFTLWIERNEKIYPAEYKKHIAELLEMLWGKGFEAVCACDFEDELPYSGGIKQHEGL